MNRQYQQLSSHTPVEVKLTHDRNGNSVYTAVGGGTGIRSVHKYEPELSRDDNVLAAVFKLVKNAPYRGVQTSQTTWFFVHLHK